MVSFLCQKYALNLFRVFCKMGRALPPSPEISSMTPSTDFPSQMEKGDLSTVDEGKFYSVTEEDDTNLSPNIFQKV